MFQIIMQFKTDWVAVQVHNLHNKFVRYVIEINAAIPLSPTRYGLLFFWNWAFSSNIKWLSFKNLLINHKIYRKAIFN